MKNIIVLLLIVYGTSFAQERPNVLFIFTDDQSTRTVSSYPDAYHWTDTPNIDKFASQGIQFNNAYIGSWCMPSRATFLTGLHQHAIQSMRMEGEYPGCEYDPELCEYWPKALRSEGYYTAQIGKWHTGTDTGYGRDWDHQIVWNRPRYPENSPNYYYDQLTEIDGQPPVMVEGYTTDNYTDWAVEFIEGKNRDESKPWFLWLCYGAVHGPFTPADRHLDDYADADTPDIEDIYPPRPGKPAYVNRWELWEKGPGGIPVEKARVGETPVGMVDTPGRPLKDWIRQYQQGVLAIDEGVARLLQSLKDSGQDENTIVVFTSDQGFAWGQHGYKGKMAPYRAAISAPLIFRLPPKLANANRSRGTVVQTQVSGVDVPVTLFSLMGLDLPWKMHGHDLTPLLLDPEAKWNYPAVMIHTARQFGENTQRVPTLDEPLILYHPPTVGVPWYVMLSQGRYKYIRTLVEGEMEELYDVVSDPDELHNLAFDKSYRQVLLKYRKAMIKELKRTDAKFVNDMPSVAEL
ncbi:sulfatase-like hydrolase/transferase [Opitutia bacterium ISCC 51]|nr:sulfatase-like hydrolase/transferase [Opitutae bacterium ISCC 51]QXD29142.1 sulfatase-like hydrolase/transferase [Opitutae bacterium ISCC 52]